MQMMENEFMFWIENRMTTISIDDEVHTLAHYTSNVSYPRPGIDYRMMIVHTIKLMDFLPDIHIDARIHYNFRELF